MADTTEERGGEGRRRRHHRHKRRSGDDEGHGEGKPSRSRGSHSHSRRHSRRSRREEVQEQAGHIAKVLQETGRVVGYDDEENPFGDENLSQAFVWHKKIEKQLEGGATERAFSAEEVRQRHEERLKEIEQVKKRRLEREKELARKQEELDLQQKERVLEEAAELEQRDEGFHAEQVRIRSEIRLREGRPKPADVFYDLLNGVSQTAANLQEPFAMLEMMERSDLEDLEREVRAHAGLDAHDEERSQFWRAVSLVCSEEAEERRRETAAEEGKATGAAGEGVHSSLEGDIRGLLRGKTVGELRQLESSVSAKLEAGATGDEEYWQAVLRKTRIHLARCAVLVQYERRLGDFASAGEGAGAEARAEEEAGEEEEEEGTAAGASRHDRSLSPGPSVLESEGDEPWVGEAKDAEEVRAARARVRTQEQSRLNAAVGSGVLNRKTLEATRLAAGPARPSSSAPSKPAPATAEDAKMAAYSNSLMGEGSENDRSFAQEVRVDRKVEWWHQKYQARKPKYFNRVHTGFEWTKYNQTHYDHDNPPPKVVKGYKFNIFYPDLIDKQKAPTYRIEKDPDCEDYSTCLIRFQAGPPYEDVAFKIVNKEWEYATKHGFKSSFERGILHLFFNFKRTRYRK